MDSSSEMPAVGIGIDGASTLSTGFTFILPVKVRNVQTSVVIIKTKPIAKSE